MWVKCVFDHGWHLHNPTLGAPGAMDMRDFPMADSLHLFFESDAEFVGRLSRLHGLSPCWGDC